MTIGQRIKRRREELGMTQDELAKKCGYTSRSTINKIEKECNNLKQNKIKIFADALDVSPSYILGFEEKEIIKKAQEEANMILKYRSLPAEDRKTIDDMLEYLYSKAQKRK